MQTVFLIKFDQICVKEMIDALNPDSPGQDEEDEENPEDLLADTEQEGWQTCELWFDIMLLLSRFYMYPCVPFVSSI